MLWCLLCKSRRENSRRVHPDRPPPHAWFTYILVRTLRNIAIYGGDIGRKAVIDATTSELKHMLPTLEENVRSRFNEDMASSTRQWILETWSDWLHWLQWIIYYVVNDCQVQLSIFWICLECGSEKIREPSFPDHWSSAKCSGVIMMSSQNLNSKLLADCSPILSLLDSTQS